MHQNKSRVVYAEVKKRDEKIRADVEQATREYNHRLARRNVAIYERWRAGESQAQIGRDYGVSRQRVSAIIGWVSRRILAQERK